MIRTREPVFEIMEVRPVPLPGPLADNPSLDRWVSFPAPGKVIVNTGRVEIGQGVLTAIAQIAADELDVEMERIVIRSGDTELTPNEGYTAGSQSMQSGGVAMRQACADVRALFLAQAAAIIGCRPGELTDPRRQHPARRQADRTGLLDARRRGKPRRQGDRQRHAQVGRRLQAHRRKQRAPRSARQDFRQGHLHPRHADCPAWCMRAWCASPIAAPPSTRVDEKAIARAAKGKVDFVRTGNFLAIVGDDETAVDLAGAAAVNARHLAKRRDADRAASRSVLGSCSGLGSTASFGAPAGEPQGRQRFEATYSRGYLAHASISPSCGLAEYRDGHLTVWTHCQGVFPLARIARQGARPRRVRDHRAPRAGLRLLRPQRRRRCRGRRRHHRHADAGQAGPRALAARGGIRLRAEDAGHGGKGPGAARRRRQAGRLDAGNLERRPTTTGPAPAACCSAR